MVILDATAGNRFIWPNKNPPLTIFIDRELRLARPPDIFADNRFCPFRDNVFDCVIYDPPYYVRADTNWIFHNPDLSKRPKNGGTPFSHFGLYSSKIELFSNLFRASKEFHRISDRLCFKWGDGAFGLWRILPFFTPWIEVHRIVQKSRGFMRKDSCYWVTFIR